MYKKQRRINDSEFEPAFEELGYDVQIVEGVAHLPQWQLYRLMQDWKDQRSALISLFGILCLACLLWLFTFSLSRAGW